MLATQDVYPSSTAHLTNDERRQRLREKAFIIDMQLLSFARESAEFAVTKAWEEEGSETAIDWLRFNCHMTSNAAADLIAVGKNLGRMPDTVQAVCQGEIGVAHVKAMARTANNKNGVLNVCLNYGGRAEIVDAVRSLVRDGISESKVDEAAISARMYQPSLADPDLIIRTAGEHRVSNFLLWQGAYAEMLVTDTLWPDFGEDDLKAALADYASRVRRFGARPADEVVAS